MRYFATTLLLLLAGLLQSTDFLSVGGVKPNWLLVVIILLVITGRPLLEYVMWSLLATFLLRFSPEPLLWHQLAFLMTVMAIFILNKFLPWSHYINLMAAVIISTALFYLLLSPNFIWQHWTIVIGEIIYNLIVVSILVFVWPRGRIMDNQ